MNDFSQRREYPRIELNLDVRYIAQAGSAKEGEVADISARGLRLETHEPLEAGTELYLTVDAGSEHSLEGTATVAWCRERKLSTGRVVYDVGARVKENWLAKDRSPLANALAQVLTIDSSEPARRYERVEVSWAAKKEGEPVFPLQLIDISAGGMRFSTTFVLDSVLVSGMAASVEIVLEGQTFDLAGTVAWVAGQRHLGLEGDEPVATDTFGLSFENLDDAQSAALKSCVEGKSVPESLNFRVLS